MVHDINVEFALHCEAGKGEVTAAEEGDGRVDGVGAVAKVEFGVEGVAEEEFDDYFALLDLAGEAAEASFVGIGGGSEG